MLADYWYPYKSTITGVSQAVQAVITTTTAHGLTIGQEVRLIVPSIRNSNAFGMTELNGMKAYITEIVSDVEFAINIDTTSFTAFNLPLTTANRQFAQVIPIGENTAVALAENQNILADATLNIADTQ